MSSAMELEGEHKVGSQLFFAMLKRNRPQLTLLTTLLAAVCLFITLQLGNVYRTTAILQFSPTGSQLTTPDTHINRHITQLKQLNNSGSPMAQRQVAELDVSRVNNSYLIKISIESQQPEQLATSLDMTLTTYIADNADYITSDQVPDPAWLKSKLSDISIQIEALTLDINQLTQQINMNSNNLADNLAELHQNEIIHANYAAQYARLQDIYQQRPSAEQLRRFDLSLYQSASEPVSVSDERNANIFAAVMLTWLLLCSILILTMSRLREKIADTEDIKYKLHTPLIAITLASEQLNENDQKKIAHYTKNYFQQAFLLNRQLNRKKILTLTSIHPQEGTTQATWQLASAISNDKKILIVDLNIAQNPRTIDWLKSSFETNFATPNISSAQSKITPPCPSLKCQNKIYHSIVDNIHVMPLDEDWLQQSNTSDLQQLRANLLKSMKNYDLILFDAPALNTSDAAMKVSQISDGTLLIIKPNTNSVGQIRKHMLTLLKNYTPIDGVILNQAQVTQAIVKQLKLHPQANG